MKILIADDQTQRYRSLITKLITLGIPRENIDLVPSAQEARERLEKFQYDVFILDILLPLWSEDEGNSGLFSKDILFELYNNDELYKPTSIVGITGDKSTVKEEILSFENCLLGVVEYSASASIWEDKIVKVIRYVENLKQQSLDIENLITKESIDLVIVCALKDPELSEILKLNWNWQPPIALNNKLFINKGEFQSNGKRFSVVAAHAGRMGMVSSALTCSILINTFNPKVITMTGICAGIEGKVCLGDIIFAELVWDYQNGKRLDNGDHELDPHQVSAASCVKAHAQQLQESDKIFKAMAIEFNSNTITQAPKLYIGPMAVGSAVLADKKIVDDIIKQNRKVLGVEMETYGLYSAAHDAPHPSPKVFALKSVCDFADSSKNDNFQSYAAYTSAQTLKALVENYGHGFIN